MLAPLPKEAVLARLLTDLFDLATQVKPATAPQPTGTAAVYSTDAGQNAFFLLVDLPCSVALSAALARIPVGAIAEVLKAGSLPEHLADNLHEVLNVIGSLFNDNESDHVKLGAVLSQRDAQFKPTWTQAEKAEKRARFTVSVKGYGGGQLSICSMG